MRNSRRLGSAALLCYFLGNVIEASTALAPPKKYGYPPHSVLSCLSRRQAVQSVIAGSAVFCWSAVAPPASAVLTKTNSLQNYVYASGWTGTGLDLLSYQEAARIASSPTSSFTMGKWPDPILRRPASKFKFASKNEDDFLQSIAHSLRRTARVNKAVGLAAQQCAIDVSLIFLDDLKQRNNNRHNPTRSIDEGGMFLVNPRIVARSSEMDMQVWNEECLVLPPTFRATVLRDAAVTVEYETLNGDTQTIQLHDELARCLQHELDHDRGILITDHVGLNDLESDTMRDIERVGHEQRQALAYTRFISEPSGDDNKTTLFASWRQWLVPNAYADEKSIPATDAPSTPNTARTDANDSCNESCLEERKRIIQERRAMMNQSRSNTNRADVFELSRQRAKLYGTQYKGASCPPGVPCI